MGDELDAVVISVGTGGSITGDRPLPQGAQARLIVVGADPEGSVFTACDESDVHPYLVEGIGKDSFPETFDPSVVDEYVRVSDRDSFLTARASRARKASSAAARRGRRSSRCWRRRGGTDPATRS